MFVFHSLTSLEKYRYGHATSSVTLTTGDSTGNGQSLLVTEPTAMFTLVEQVEERGGHEGLQDQEQGVFGWPTASGHQQDYVRVS